MGTANGSFRPKVAIKGYATRFGYLDRKWREFPSVHSSTKLSKPPRYRADPSDLSFFVVVGELLALLVLAFAFALAISGLRYVAPTPTPCDLGQFGWVPYVSNHSSVYCSLGQRAVELTAIYYAASLTVLLVAHFLYTWRRTRIRESNEPLGRLIAPPIMFAATAFSWLIGLDGRRVHVDDLTNGSIVPFGLTIFIMVACHATCIPYRYEERDRWPWQR